MCDRVGMVFYTAEFSLFLIYFWHAVITTIDHSELCKCICIVVKQARNAVGWLLRTTENALFSNFSIILLLHNETCSETLTDNTALLLSVNGIRSRIQDSCIYTALHQSGDFSYQRI